MQLCKTLTFVHVNYKTIHAAIVKELHHNEFTRGILKEILHSSDSSAYNDQVLSELLRPRLLDNESDVLQDLIVQQHLPVLRVLRNYLNKVHQIDDDLVCPAFEKLYNVPHEYIAKVLVHTQRLIRHV